jgi:hypothetical protein
MNLKTIVLKPRDKKPLNHKRIRMHGRNIPPNVLEEMAEREEMMSRYEHGQEVG